MTEYDNRNTFVLFKNDRKREDRDADYTGTFTDENGREFYINGYIRTKKGDGSKFIGGAMKPKDSVRRSEPTQGRRASVKDQLDDEVPF